MPIVAAIVEMLMIDPPPLAAIFGAMVAVRKKGALTFTAIVASKSASLNWSVGPPGKIPALFTRTSTAPASSPRRLTSSKLARSAATNLALPPVDSIAVTTSLPRARSRPLTMTSAPSRASRSATARPMPEVPPVTSAVLS